MTSGVPVRLLTIHEHPHILDETVYDHESLNHGHPSLILRESFQSSQDRLDHRSSKTLFYGFNCMVLSEIQVNENGLTWLTLLELSGRQSERGEQLQHYLDDHIIHCGSRRDPCIYFDMNETMLNQLEQVGKCVIASLDPHSRLVCLDVKRLPT